ncbi:MAG TPA: alpha/beta hydrolase [Ohtaekwangia sp.]|nr:alpha/beta hydrolase [Ohtaekwangia sp.]
MRLISLVPAGALISLALLLEGCYSFREPPKVIHKYFRDHNVEGRIAHYTALNRKMYYAETGQPGKPVVFFVHGSPGSLSAFVPFLTDSLLLQRTLLITVDRPGFGYSGYKLAEPSLDRQSAILKAIVAEKKSDQPVILVGHSLAGPLVAKMAIQYPELIDGIVIVAGSIDPDLEPNDLWFRAPLATPFLSWIVPGAFRPSNEELYQLEPQLRAMLPDWQKITCPVVVIHGKKDQFVPFENISFAERSITSTPVKYILDDEANHFIPWAKPEMITNGIHYLLDNLTAQNAGLKPVTSAPDSLDAVNDLH